MNQPKSSRSWMPVIIIIAVLAASAGFYISLKQAQNQQKVNAKKEIAGLLWPNQKQIRDFSMLDQNGNPFGLQDIKDKWSLLFFGYTHCPDICPLTMLTMKESYAILHKQYPDLQMIFVSVDPERDTPETILQYINYFDSDFIGLGGDMPMLQSLAQQIGIVYYRDTPENNDNYLIDHTASIFVIDPEGYLVGKISPPHSKTQIVAQLSQIKTFIGTKH